MIGYVGLGSNLGDREAALAAGLAGMARCGMPPSAVSSVWETEPVDCPEPLWFLNLVARIDTGASPRDVLASLLRIERDVGRLRSTRNAARILDLDLLLLGDCHCYGPDIVLPHPRMWQRRFVLEPLAELAPTLVHPETGRTVVEACRELGVRPVVRRLGRLALPRALPL